MLKLELTAAESERAKIAAQTVAELRETVRHKDDVIGEYEASIAVLQKQVKVCAHACVLASVCMCSRACIHMVVCHCVAQDKTVTLHKISELVLRATGAVGLSEFGMIDGEQLPSILDSVLQSKSSLLLQLSDASLKHDEKVKQLDDELAETEDRLAGTQAALQGASYS